MTRRAILGMLLIASLSLPGVLADLPDAGMTPDSPFHFLERWVDAFRNPAIVADKRAAEVIAMAEENKVKALEKAVTYYARAMEKRQSRASTEDDHEAVANRMVVHLTAFARAQERAAFDAREPLNTALQRSAQHRGQAIDALEATNQERARRVAQETLEQLLSDVPEAALPGISRAMHAVGSDDAPRFGDAPVPQMEYTPPRDAAQPAPRDGVPPVDAGDGAPQGDFRVLVTDQPTDIGDFSSLVVTFHEARVFRSDAEDDRAWFMMEFDERVDFTVLVDGNAIELFAASLDPGEYSKIELWVADVVGVVENATVTVDVPSNKLQIVRPFTVAPDSETVFVFDISVIQRGPFGDYALLPVIAKSGVVGADIAEDAITEVACTLDADCDDPDVCVDGFCAAA